MNRGLFHEGKTASRNDPFINSAGVQFDCTHPLRRLFSNDPKLKKIFMSNPFLRKPTRWKPPTFLLGFPETVLDKETLRLYSSQGGQ